MDPILINLLCMAASAALTWLAHRWGWMGNSGTPAGPAGPALPMPSLPDLNLPETVMAIIKQLATLPPGTHRPIVAAICRAEELPPAVEQAIIAVLDAMKVPAPIGAVAH